MGRCSGWRASSASASSRFDSGSTRLRSTAATAVLLSVTGARRLVRENPDAATETLLEAEVVGRASLAEIRATVRALRDERTTGAGAAPMPAAGDLRELVERMVAAGSSGQPRRRPVLRGDERRRHAITFIFYPPGADR